MGFYIESTDRPYTSYNASEDIKVGTLVVAQGDGTVALADAQNDSDFDGVATAPRRAEYIADYDYETTNFEYLADTSGSRFEALTEGGPMLVPYGGGADGDVIKVRTVLETTSGVTAAPSISDQDVVGFVDTSDANAPTSAGRIVEEGYTNDEDNDTTSTTFNRSNSNFVAIGRAHKPKTGEGDDYDDIVRVKVRSDL